MKNKHLSFDNRLEIEKGLKSNQSFKQIGQIINKDCTTVSKEIRNHVIFKNTGAPGRPFLDCVHERIASLDKKEYFVIIKLVNIMKKRFVPS